MIIIHSGTNDIQKKVNTLQKVRNVITTIKEIDVNIKVQIAFSGVIHRNDQDLKGEVKEINRKLENLCKGKKIKFINNNNTDSSCLNGSKLHLNKSGTAQLIKKFSQALNQIDYEILTMVLLIKQPTLFLSIIPACFTFRIFKNKKS